MTLSDSLKMKVKVIGTHAEHNLYRSYCKIHTSIYIPSLKLLLDCGQGVAEQVKGLDIDCVMITHGHPDHYDPQGISLLNPKEVYFTNGKEAKIKYKGIDFHFIPVYHSIRCPMTIISFAGITYAPDFLGFKGKIPRGKVWIGDGSAYNRSIVRPNKVGHMCIKAQLELLRGNFRRFLFLHWGQWALRVPRRIVGGLLRQLGAEPLWDKEEIEL